MGYIGTKSLNAFYVLSRICSGEPESCFIHDDEIYVGRYNLSNRQVLRLKVFMEDIAASDATCSKSGTIAHAECNLCDEYFSLDDYASVITSIEDASKPIDESKHSYYDDCNSYCKECGKFRQVSFGTYTDNFSLSSALDWNKDGSYVTNRKLNLSGKVINNYIGSENQYISVDIRGSELTNGFEILARVNDDGSSYYSFKVTANALELNKSGTVLQSDSSFVFDSTKLYRISFSVVENELKAIIHDYTDDSTLLSITCTDTNALTGTYFGFKSTDSGITLDNVYFSASEFRKNDNGWFKNDVNGDGEFDIRDLVYTEEQKHTTEDDVKTRADKDNDKSITDSDICLVRKYILSIFSEEV